MRGENIRLKSPESETTVVPEALRKSREVCPDMIFVYGDGGGWREKRRERAAAV